MKGIILLDLDETVHLSEEHLKTPSWNHILEPFGYIWKTESDKPQNELTLVENSQRPQIGLPPLLFIRHLIDQLHLSPSQLSYEVLEKSGFNKINIGKILAAADLDELVKALAEEWAYFLTERVKKEGAKPVPGAPEMIKELHNAGYRIGIVTQAPKEYAQAVLRSLGLITEETSYIEAIVGGEMVAKPKPDPEPLKLATQIILFNELYGKLIDYYGGEDAIPIEEKIGLEKVCQGEFLEKNKPIAYIGDSVSDVIAGKAWNLRVIVIRNETTNLAQIVELGAEMIVSPENIHPGLFGNETNIDHPVFGSIER